MNWKFDTSYSCFKLKHEIIIFPRNLLSCRAYQMTSYLITISRHVFFLLKLKWKLPSRSPSSSAMVVAEWTEVESSNKPAHIPYITNMVEKHREEDEDLDDISLRSTRSHWSTWFAVRFGSGCSIGRAAGPTPPRIRTLFQNLFFFLIWVVWTKLTVSAIY